MISSPTLAFLLSTLMLFWLCRLSNSTGRPTLSTIYEINLNETTGFEVNLERYNVSDAGIEEFNAARLEKIRESQKQKRIEDIRKQIMLRVGGFQNKPNITFIVSEDARDKIAKKLEELQLEQENNTPNSANEIYAERVQSFYPSCSLPRNTDREVWDDPTNFHIYYNISSPRQLQGTSINVSAAKLRLYKNFDGTLSKSSLSDGESDVVNDQPWNDEANHSENDEFLRVTVYQFLKPLRRHRRPKKKSLDSKRVSLNYEGWIEFNIQSSIRDWFENGNKNFGLEIILQDANEVSQNPSSFFQNMNCSESRANDPPFPRNLFEDDPTVGDNETAIFDNETYPTLDLRTVEFQEVVIPISNVSDLRRKRNASYGNTVDTQVCHLKEGVYYTFKEIGLDCITEPTGFTWFECVGSCHIENETGTSNKSGFCYPNDFASLRVTITEENNSYNTTIPNFMVSSCLCSSSKYFPQLNPRTI